MAEGRLPALELLVNAVLHVVLRHGLVAVQDGQVLLQHNKYTRHCLIHCTALGTYCTVAVYNFTIYKFDNPTSLQMLGEHIYCT